MGLSRAGPVETVVNVADAVFYSGGHMGLCREPGRKAREAPWALVSHSALCNKVTELV
jgi:hypothetical protein